MTDYAHLFNKMRLEAEKGAKEKVLLSPLTPSDAALFQELAQHDQVRTYTCRRVETLIDGLNTLQDKMQEHGGRSAALDLVLEELALLHVAVWFKDTAMMTLLWAILERHEETRKRLNEIYTLKKET